MCREAEEGSVGILAEVIAGDDVMANPKVRLPKQGYSFGNVIGGKSESIASLSGSYDQ